MQLLLSVICVKLHIYTHAGLVSCARPFMHKRQKGLVIARTAFYFFGMQQMNHYYILGVFLLSTGVCSKRSYNSWSCRNGELLLLCTAKAAPINYCTWSSLELLPSGPESLPQLELLPSECSESLQLSTKLKHLELLVSRSESCCKFFCCCYTWAP